MNIHERAHFQSTLQYAKQIAAINEDLALIEQVGQNHLSLSCDGPRVLLASLDYNRTRIDLKATKTKFLPTYS
jgi:hypothetical protein